MKGSLYLIYMIYNKFNTGFNSLIVKGQTIENNGSTKWNMLFGVGINPLFSRGSKNQVKFAIVFSRKYEPMLFKKRCNY